jgi:hypothetical protein
MKVMNCRARSVGLAMPRLAAGFEGLDDDHTPAAARTSVPLFVFETIFTIAFVA